MTIKKLAISLLIIVSLLSVFSLSGCGKPTSTDTSTTSTTTSTTTFTPLPGEPALSIDLNKQYTVVMKVIENGQQLGDVTIQLFPKEAPHAVNNFVYLIRQGFYNGVTFHRIIKGFMIQGGDPNGTGTGGPGYTIADDKPITRDYVPGTLAMANTGYPNSGGSQFFITLTNLSDTTNQYQLPKSYVIFGLVTSGFDIVQEIGNVHTVQGSDGNLSKPTVDVHIGIATVTES
jgi:cyclophilin family peptidyl-prolyl cis-trans isomerase